MFEKTVTIPRKWLKITRWYIIQQLPVGDPGFTNGAWGNHAISDQSFPKTHWMRRMNPSMVTEPDLEPGQIQWRIQDFREEGVPIPKVGAPTYYFDQFFLKTAWKRKHLDRVGGASLVLPLLDPPMRWHTFLQWQTETFALWAEPVVMALLKEQIVTLLIYHRHLFPQPRKPETQQTSYSFLQRCKENYSLNAQFSFISYMFFTCWLGKRKKCPANTSTHPPVVDKTTRLCHCTAPFVVFGAETGAILFIVSSGCSPLYSDIDELIFPIPISRNLPHRPLGLSGTPWITGRIQFEVLTSCMAMKSWLLIWLIEFSRASTILE